MELAASHIKKSFGSNKILVDVSFKLSAGKVVVLLGTNGAGKTTLFNILSGFLKPDNGEVFLDKISLLGLKPSAIARLGIGRTFQDMRLIENMSVFENLMLSFPAQEGEKWWNTLFPLPKVATEENVNAKKAKQILQDCFIEDVADNEAKDLSYGQQKLLNLACCMARNASIWLLDEPAAGVSPAYREKLSEVIQQQKSEGKSILLIEHNSDFIKAVADEIFFLNRGVIRSFLSYDEFRQDTDVKDAYV